MHSIPPLVTISSAASGRRPCCCSWRSTMYSRTLGMPSGAVYWSATSGSSRISRATISAISPVGNVSGLGKPPASDSTPGGAPARIVASSLSVDAELKRAPLSGAEPRRVLGVARQVVHGPALGHRREHRALGAGDRLAALQRGLDPLRRRDDQTVVVAEHDVAGLDVDAPAAHGLAECGTGHGAARRG